MNHLRILKSVICIILALCLTLGCVPFAGGMQIIYHAQAEEAPAAAKTVSGGNGWLYNLLPDGTAEILGHTDTSVSGLTLPLSVDGAWVSAIGENAFAQHTSLTSVTIPVTVTSIADTAFPGMDHLTVSAFHGSQALAFAERKGMTTAVLSELDFMDGVLDLSEMAPTQWILIGDRLQVSQPFASLLQAGGKVYLPPCDTFPAGYAVQVLSLFNRGAGVVASVTELPFVEAVASYRAENIQLQADMTNFVPAEGVTVIPQAASRSVASTSATLPLTMKINKKINDHLSIEGVFGTTFSSSVSVDYSFMSINSYSFNTDVRLAIDVSIVGEAANRTDSDDPEKFFLGEAPLVGNPIINGTVFFYLYYDIKGELKISAELTTTGYTSWSQEEGLDSDFKSNPLVNSCEITGKVRCGIAPDLALTLGWGKVRAKITGFEANAGFFAEAKYTSAAPYCFNVDVGVEVSIDFYIGLITTKIQEIKFGGNIYNYQNVIKRWHLEGLEKKVQDRCTYEGACTVQFVTSVDCDYPESEVYSKGQPIGYLEKPSREGYLFKGWYTDAALKNIFDLQAPLERDFLQLFAAWEPIWDEPSTPTPNPMSTPTPPSGGNMSTPVPGGITGNLPYAPIPNPDLTPSGFPGIQNVLYPLPEGSWYVVSKSGVFSGIQSNSVYTQSSNSPYYEYVASIGPSGPVAYTLPEYLTYSDIQYLYAGYITNANGTTTSLYERVEYAPPTQVKVTEVNLSYGSNIGELVLPDGLKKVTLSYEYPYKVTWGSNIETIELKGSKIANINIADAGSITAEKVTTREVTLTNVDSVSGFSDVSCLETVTLTNVASVYGFNNLPALTSASIVSDGDLTLQGFNNCPNLTALTIEAGGDLDLNTYGALNSLTSLETLTIKAGGVVRLDNVLNYCSSLKTLIIEAESCPFVENSLNFCPALSSFTICPCNEYNNSFNLATPSDERWTVKVKYSLINSFNNRPIDAEIENPYKVWNCSTLRNVTATKTALELYKGVFFNCPALELVRLPGSVRTPYFEDHFYITPTDSAGNVYHDAETFAGCGSVTVELGYGCTSITEAGNFIGLSTRDVNWVISPTVESIGSQAFYGQYSTQYEHIRLPSVREITIPSSVKTIDAYAFSDCAELEKITFSEGLETIGASAFDACTGLTEIILPDSLKTVGNYAFYECTGLRTLDYPDGVQFNDYAFSFTGLEEIYISPGAQTWGSGVFASCPNLTKATLDPKLTKVPSGLFSGTETLAEVVWPEELTEISSNAFHGTGFTSIEVPETVVTIGQGAFGWCRKLESIKLPSGLTEIAPKLLWVCDVLETAELPAQVTSIGSEAFSGCDALKSINIPAGVTTIGDSAFSSCSALAEITLPEGLASIGDDAFTWCSALRSVVLPSSMRSIGASAFQQCENLQNITFNEGLETIGEDAFRYSGLVSVDLPATLKHLPGSALSGTPWGILTVRNNDMTTDTEMYDNLWWHTDGTIYADEESVFIQGIFDQLGYCPVLLLPIDSKLLMVTYCINPPKGSQSIHQQDSVYSGTLLKAPAKPSLTNYQFAGWYKDPDGKEPWDFASDKMPQENLLLFAKWERHLASIVIPGDGGVILDSMVAPEDFAEIPAVYNGQPVIGLGEGCVPRQVKQLHIPASVRTIAQGAFAQATQLTSITVAEDNPSFYAKDGVLFTSDGLLICYPSAREGESYTVPEGTSAIASHAFLFTQHLKNLTLPQSLVALASETIGMGCEIETVHFGSDPLDIADDAFTGLHRIAVSGPAQAPVLLAWLNSRDMLYNAHAVRFVDGQETLAAFDLMEGDLIDSAILPDDSDMSRKGELMLGWSATGSADDLWDFENNKMPAADLTLYAVRTSAYRWEPFDNGVQLTEYLDQTMPAYIPSYIEGKPVLSISSGCFAGFSTVSLTGDNYTLAQDWAYYNGAEYTPVMCTIVFHTMGGTEIATMRVPMGESIFYLPTPGRYGYSFSEWADYAKNWTGSYSYTPTAETIDLYAIWLESNYATGIDDLLDYTLTEDGAVITGITGEVAQLDIPATLGGQNVVGIGDRAFEGKYLVHVTLPVTLTFIGSDAFRDCQWLESVTLPGSLSTLGAGAFHGCGHLSGITIPESVTRLEGYTFAYCSSLKDISIHAGITEIAAHTFVGCTGLESLQAAESNPYYASADGVLYSKDSTQLLLYPAGKKDEAFAIPEGTLVVGPNAMSNSRIRHLTIPSTLVSFGKHAASSSTLENIVFPQTGDILIDEGAFRGCANLKEATLTTAVTRLNAHAFESCPLGKVFIGNNSIQLDETAFAITPQLLIHGAEGSAAQAWANAHGAIFVGPDDILPTSVSMDRIFVQVGQQIALQPVFEPADTTITQVTWHWNNTPGIAIIENGVLLGCNAGTARAAVTTANGLRCEFDVIVYEDLADITSVELSTNHLVMHVGDGRSLNATVFPEAPLLWSTSDEHVAYYQDGMVYAVGAGTAIITAYTESGASATCAVSVTSNSKLTLDIGYLEIGVDWYYRIMAYLDGQEIDPSALTWRSDNESVAYYSANLGGILAVSPGETTIYAQSADGATASCRVLVQTWGTITLPAALTYIEDEAFKDSIYYFVACPEGLQSIGSCAFANNVILWDIYIPASVTYIADDAFEGCIDLEWIEGYTGSCAESYALEHGISFYALDAEALE